MRALAITAGPEPCRQGPDVTASTVGGSSGGPSPGHSALPSPPSSSAAAANAAAPRARRRLQPSGDDDQAVQQHRRNDTRSLVPKPAFPWNRPPGPFNPRRPTPWLLVALAPLPPLPAPAIPRPRPFFRYWIDSQALSSAASTVLLERALVELGGRRTGGPPKREENEDGVGRRAAAEATARLAAASAAAAAAITTVPPLQQPPREYGYMHMGEWDFLWSITAKAVLAAELLRPGQLVSVVPGFLSVSRKTSLVRSLAQAYGRGVAFTVVPLTFKLPEELDAWARVLAREGRDAKWGAAEAADRSAAAASREPQQGHHPPSPSSSPAAASAGPLWMLKNNKQRGTGLRLVPGGPGAFQAAFETAYRPGKMSGLPLYRWYLAQRYVSDPLLLRPYGGTGDWVLAAGAGDAPGQAWRGAGEGGGLEGAEEKKAPPRPSPSPPPPLDNRPRKFGLRVWALVPSAAAPFRAYLHTRGLVLFSSRPYTSDPWATSGAADGAAAAAAAAASSAEEESAAAAAVPEGHLTNAARNAGAPVWPLRRLAETLGPSPWRELWEQLCVSTALALASAQRRVRERRADLALPKGGAFQLFGLDFVVDASLRPWLLEVNATPSMRVDHPCPVSAAVVEGEKWPAVWDALAALQVAPERFVAAGANGRAGAAGASASSSSSAPRRRWPFSGWWRGRRGGEEDGEGDEDAAEREGGAPPPPRRWRQQQQEAPPVPPRTANANANNADAPEASIADVTAEMRRAGGYVPLAHLFPDAETLPGCSVPWTPADDALRRWLRREQAEERRRRRAAGGGGEGGAWGGGAPFSWHAWS